MAGGGGVPRVKGLAERFRRRGYVGVGGGHRSAEEIREWGGLGGRVGEARQVLAVPWRVTTVESLHLQIDTVYPMLHAGMKIGVMVSAESSFQARWLSEAQWAFLQIADSTMAGADVRAGPMTTARSSFVLVFRNLVGSSTLASRRRGRSGP